MGFGIEAVWGGEILDEAKVPMTTNDDVWPSLPLAEWQDTCATLQLWMQVVGKIRLAQARAVNHWWRVPLYMTARGLTTSPMPFGALTFQIDFDFIDHRLLIANNDGRRANLPLEPRSVSDFYQDPIAQLKALGISVKIWTMPVEIPDAIPFERDDTHAAYDMDYANRFWRILVECDHVFCLFRSRFVGKVSPIHSFGAASTLPSLAFGPSCARPHGNRAASREVGDARGLLA